MQLIKETYFTGFNYKKAYCPKVRQKGDNIITLSVHI